MATQTLATADAILKDLYVGPIIEQLNQKTYMLEQIERDADHIDHTGRRAVVPVHSGRNRGRGSRADNATLPAAGTQSWQDAIIPMHYHYYGIEVTDPAIEGSTNNEGAFVNILEAETKGVATDMRKDINRQVFGTGDGLLATIRGTTGGSGTTIPVDQGIQYIQVGDTVDIVVKSSGAETNGKISTAAAPVTVLTRTANSATPQFTTSVATVGALDNTYGVYLAGNRNNEMDGLRNITAQSRTLHSINSSTAGNSFWDGQQRDAALAVAGESLFEQLADDVGTTGNAEVQTFITTRGIRRRLADTYQSQKRFNDAQAVKIHGGYTAIFVNEMPVIADDDAPKGPTAASGFAFAINEDAFRWFEQTKPGWLTQRDGSVFNLKDSTVASGAGFKTNVWQAWFKWYAVLGCTAPNRTGRVINAADDNAI